MGDKTLPLARGETIAGRDPSSAFWLDRPSVSRSHARFIVDEAFAWVEDLGSLNGTLVGGTRITRRMRLHRRRHDRDRRSDADPGLVADRRDDADASAARPT